MVVDAAGVTAAEADAAFVVAVVPSSAAVESCAELAVAESGNWPVASCCSVADAA